MPFPLKVTTYVVYGIHLLIYGKVFICDPGLATIPVIEFEKPLTQDQAE